MSPVRRASLLITLGILVFARVAHAEPCSDSSELRSELQKESARVRHWKLAWRITYSALAVGQLAIAASGAADRDNTRSLWVGGVKASLGAIGAFASPLHIDVPPPSGDACDDRSTLRNIAERAAADEREAFWTNHIGALIITAAGAVVVSELVSWKAGLLSIATGYPVSLLSTYTMPRASWGRVREPVWTATIVSGPGQYSFVIGGSF